jgi:hypothetical protein
MRISFKKVGSKMGKMPPIKKSAPKKSAPKKPAAAQPSSTTIKGARKETKFSPNSMYKIKNEYGDKGNLISTDTSRTLKGKLFGAPKKGGVTTYKRGGSVKK